MFRFLSKYQHEPYQLSEYQRRELLAVQRETKARMDSALLLWYRAGMPADLRPKLCELWVTLEAARLALATAEAQG